MVDLLCQDIADELEEEFGSVDPDRLERRLAHRVANLTDEDIAALCGRLAVRRASRMVTQSVRSAIRHMRGE